MTRNELLDNLLMEVTLLIYTRYEEVSEMVLQETDLGRELEEIFDRYRKPRKK